MPILLKDDANYPIPQLVKADGSFVPARGTDNGEALVSDLQLKSVQDTIKMTVSTISSDVSVVKTDVGTITSDIDSIKNSTSSIDTRIVTIINNTNDIKNLLNEINGNLDGLEGLLTSLETRLDEIVAKLQEHKSEQVVLASSVELADTTTTYSLPSGYAGGYVILYVNVEALSENGEVTIEAADNTAFDGYTVLSKQYTTTGIDRAKVEMDTDSMVIKVSVVGAATISIIAFLKV